ncbi:ATP-binding cassette domain-containing protein [Tissierella creatinini]|nr:ATP-binding cassette domain-containing protein [Tissierella creatinini]TJX65612.1 ATP-binding cassette domain-containing protein [Soehngenia saccharolytica]
MIKVESLEFKYEDGTIALKNINIDLDKGRVVGVIGANGSGKSTLFLNILAILKPSKGVIKYNGEPIKYDKKSLREYRKEVTMVFQDPDKQLFYSKVYDDMAFVLRNLHFSEEEIEKRIHVILEKVKATDLEQKPTHFLSYGQKKRISIGGALIMDSKVLLLDEPTSGLDPKMSKEVKHIIKELSYEKKLVVSSHDMDFIYECCDYIYVISNGRVLGEGKPEEVFLKANILKEAGLDKPWLVKIHENLKLPLYRNEEDLLKIRY